MIELPRNETAEPKNLTGLKIIGPKQLVREVEALAKRDSIDLIDAALAIAERYHIEPEDLGKSLKSMKVKMKNAAARRNL